MTAPTMMLGRRRLRRTTVRMALQPAPYSTAAAPSPPCKSPTTTSSAAPAHASCSPPGSPDSLPSSNTAPEQPSQHRPTYPYPTGFNILQLVDKLSSEDNYDDWKSSMRDFIKSRGLIGFIDGTAASPGSNKYDWERSDKLVRGWILATLSKDIRLPALSSKTAQDLWKELERKYDANRPTWELDQEKKDRQRKYLALHKAAITADLVTAKVIINEDPGAVKTPITPYSQGALTLAIISGSPRRHDFVKLLLEKMTSEDVSNLVEDGGMTALHFAAHNGNMEAARMLVAKNPHLPNFLDNDRRAPLHLAALTGRREMVNYLMTVTREDILFADDHIGASLLCYLSWGELFDIALALLRQKPKLACEQPNPLSTIADKHSLFRSGNSLSFLERLIYWGVPMKLEGIANHHEEGEGKGYIDNSAASNCCTSVRRKLHFMIWEVAEKLARSVKCIRERKEKQHHALELVKLLCKEVAKSDISTVEMIFKPALRKAARVGIPEIIEEIVLSYPLALFFGNQNGIDIFKYAIMHRREQVFKLIHQIDAGWRFITLEDNSWNNGLHMAAHLRHEQQINLQTSGGGAVLQMQREVQWFKEVEKLAAPGDNERRNRDGMTPREVFSDSHQHLAKEAKKWTKDTATSCTIVAILVATMVFSAAFTIPGGYDLNGSPRLSKQKAFVIFGVFDTLALFSSSISVLTFLHILTSRYEKEDFLFALPKRLIIGFITLFVSIVSMMVSFGAALFLVFGDSMARIIIPVFTILAGISIIFFGVLQFPLIIEMIRSTYGRGIFGKRSDRVLG